MRHFCNDIMTSIKRVFPCNYIIRKSPTANQYHYINTKSMSGQGLLKHESAFRCVFEHRWVKTGEKCSYIFLSSPLLPQQRQSPMKSVGKKPSNLATPHYKWKPSDGFFVLFLHNHSLAGRSKGAVMSHIGQSDVQIVTPPSSSGVTWAAFLALAWLCLSSSCWYSWNF